MISLALLGIIATFTIPKVLSVQQNAQRIAILKETVAMISELVYQGVLTGELGSSNTRNFFQQRVNYVSFCSSNASTEGCWDQALQGNVSGDVTQPGFRLHNGAVVVGVDNCCNWGGGVMGNSVVIDWNGTDGPNISGDDILQLYLYYGTVPSSGVSSIEDGTRPGKVGPRKDRATSITLYEEIYSD